MIGHQQYSHTWVTSCHESAHAFICHHIGAESALVLKSWDGSGGCGYRLPTGADDQLWLAKSLLITASGASGQSLAPGDSQGTAEAIALDRETFVTHYRALQSLGGRWSFPQERATWELYQGVSRVLLLASRQDWLQLAGQLDQRKALSENAVAYRLSGVVPQFVTAADWAEHFWPLATKAITEMEAMDQGAALVQRVQRKTRGTFPDHIPKYEVPFGR
jgi:hypothetical protein